MVRLPKREAFFVSSHLRLTPLILKIGLAVTSETLIRHIQVTIYRTSG